MTTRSYSLIRKAPARRGKYLVRVQVDYDGATGVSATRAVTVY